MFPISGLRYNQKVIAPGAQTERRGDAGPVSVLLRGWDSPAAFAYLIRDRVFSNPAPTHLSIGQWISDDD
jgi:hypothetical protein